MIQCDFKCDSSFSDQFSRQKRTSPSLKGTSRVTSGSRESMGRSRSVWSLCACILACTVHIYIYISIYMCVYVYTHICMYKYGSIKRGRATETRSGNSWTKMITEATIQWRSMRVWKSLLPKRTEIIYIGLIDVPKNQVQRVDVPLQ